MIEHFIEFFFSLCKLAHVEYRSVVQLSLIVIKYLKC